MFRLTRAVEMSVFVVRAFVRLRELLASNSALARTLDELERKYKHHDEAITAILSAIRELTHPPAAPRHRIYRRHPVAPASGFDANSSRSSILRSTVFSGVAAAGIDLSFDAPGEATILEEASQLQGTVELI